LLVKNTDEKVWNRMILAVGIYSQEILPFRNSSVNNFLHLPPHAADMFDRWKQWLLNENF